jgi:ribonuclease P protein subunit RPR2
MKKEKNASKESNKTKIAEFFSLAQSASKIELATRYIELARSLGQKTQTRMTKAQRMQYCHNCYTFLKPNINATVRKNKYLTITCKNCNHVNKFL